MPELNALQREIREKLIEIADIQFAKDYNLTNQDIGDIFGVTRQAVYQILIRQKARRIPK